MSVVPTTTPPLVWPSNGKNKGAHTKIFESYTYGGFDIMQIRFNALNFSSDDWRYEVVWVLFDALPLMVGYWSDISFHGFMISMVVELTLYWLLLMIYTWLISFEFFLIP